MRNKPTTLLLHPIFLFSLLLLVLNDLYFKQEYHNQLTGKLSDFAGLFALFLFMISLFPSRKNIMLIILIIAFAWWKSSLSEPFISFFNTQLNIPIHRVVDYTDYIAFFILPLAYYLKPVSYNPSLRRQIAIGCIGFISFFTFTATSMVKRLADDNRVQLNKSVKTKRTETGILMAFDRNGLTYKEDSAFDHTWAYGTPYLRTKDDSGKVVYQKLDRYNIYTKTEGSVYKIEKLYVGKDSIFDLEIAIQDRYQGKNIINLRSFKHKSIPDTPVNVYSGYYIHRQLKKPIKRKFKEIVK